MRLLLGKYLKRLGTFYQVTSNKEYKEFLVQQNNDTIDEDDEMFIPFVTISRADRINDTVHYVIEVNSGSKNYEVKRTFKQFAQLDETVWQTCSCFLVLLVIVVVLPSYFLFYS